MTRAQHLSAVYLPAFCPPPDHLGESAVTITVKSDHRPMVRVSNGQLPLPDAGDRLVLVAHVSGIRLPRSDGETCDPYLYRLAQSLRCGFRRNVTPPPAYLDSLAPPLVDHLQNYYAGRTRQRERSGLSDARRAKVLAFIDAHLFDKFSIDDLAEVAFLSPFHFRHMFKRSTGSAPHAFVRRRRIEAAAGMLASTTVAIAEVARRTGFDNQAHFSTAFRRVAGVTPSHFRRLARRGLAPTLPN